MREPFIQPLLFEVVCFNKIQLSAIKSDILLVQLNPYSGYQFLYPTTKFSKHHTFSNEYTSLPYEPDIYNEYTIDYFHDI